MRENNKKIEKLLETLKVPKAGVLTLDRTFTHIFEDLTSEMLLILIPLEIHKMDLEILIPAPSIFFTTKMEPLSRKKKEMMRQAPNLPPTKGKEIMLNRNPPNKI